MSGFLDIHCHGGGGFSAEDGEDAVRGLVAAHRAHGTDRIVVSLVSNPIDRLVASLAAIRTVASEDTGVLGAHLEGPFLTPDRRGAHDPRHLISPEPALVEALIEAGAGLLRMVTIAPELPGALAAIGRLVEAGVVVAVGHTEADAATAHAAFDAGASVLTHGFNAMPGISGRAPGPLGAALADERVTIEVIADGIHVHRDNVAWLFDAAGGRVAGITDAMAGAGSGDGRYRLGDLDVEVYDERAVLLRTDSLAGSTLTMDRAFTFLAEVVGLGEDGAREALTTAPERALQIAG